MPKGTTPRAISQAYLTPGEKRCLLSLMKHLGQKTPAGTMREVLYRAARRRIDAWTVDRTRPDASLRMVLSAQLQAAEMQYRAPAGHGRRAKPPSAKAKETRLQVHVFLSDPERELLELLAFTFRLRNVSDVIRRLYHEELARYAAHLVPDHPDAVACSAVIQAAVARAARTATRLAREQRKEQEAEEGG